jgi:hypothetical protein
MTPASVMASIPDNLIRRHPDPTYQLETAKALADWLHDRGHRPSLAEIEQERARRAPTKTNPRPHHERKARP